MLGKARERGRSSPEAAGPSDWSSAHFCSGRCVAGRPLLFSRSRSRCVLTGHELGKRRGKEGGSCCCCPHLRSQSRGARAAGNGNEWAYQSSWPGACDVVLGQDWRWRWTGRSLVVQRNVWWVPRSDEQPRSFQRACPHLHSPSFGSLCCGSDCEILQNY